MRYTFFLFLIALLFVRCSSNQNKRDFDKKIQELNEKQQQLASWEQRLQAKEDSLTSVEKAMDSTRVSLDSAGSFNKALIGNWNVNMLCTQTTCEGYAIGDTKTEQWTITFDGQGYQATASANNKIVRTYTGTYKDNTLLLNTLDSGSGTAINVTLRITDNRLEGTREIVRSDCKTTYSLGLQKI